MGYIESGKAEGATVHAGGNRHGNEGYFIQPTIFTDTKPHMKIVKEEIFGPVGVLIKFEDDDDVIRQANDTCYGLASAVFSQNINRAINTAHKLHAGTAWVKKFYLTMAETAYSLFLSCYQINCVNSVEIQVPFGGYKQSGIGRECGEYALEKYVFVFWKIVHR